MHLFNFFTVVLLLTTAVGYSQQSAKDYSIKSDSPLYDPEISKFTAIAKQAGLWDLFVGTGPFTGFIPSNAAVDKLGQKKIDELSKPENRDQLVSLITYHIVHGEYLSKTIRTEDIKTVNGKNIHVQNNNGSIKVNGAHVIKKDLEGPNGVIHVIDAVLIP